MLRLVISSLLVLSFLVLRQESNACDVMTRPPSVEKVIMDADIVFAGVVEALNIGDDLHGPFKSNLKIFKTYKGWVPQRMEINGMSGGCDYNHWQFEIGKMLLIVATYDENAALHIPYYYDALSQRALLNYLEKGTGKFKSSDCIRNTMTKLDRTDGIHDSLTLNSLHKCFQKNNNEQNPFRFIPPKQDANVTRVTQ